MRIHLRIPELTYRKLSKVGDIDSLINAVAVMVANEEIPYWSLPSVGSRVSDRRLSVDITNEAFIELYKSMEEVGKPISMRRVLQHVVDSGLYEEIVLQNNSVVLHNNERMVKPMEHLCKTIELLNILYKELPVHGTTFFVCAEQLREVLDAVRKSVTD